MLEVEQEFLRQKLEEMKIKEEKELIDELKKQ